MQCHEEAQPPGGDQGGQALSQATGLCWCLIAGMVCRWGGDAACPSQGLGVTKKGMPQKPCGDQPILAGPSHPTHPAAGSEAEGQYLGAVRQQKLSLTQPQLSLVAHIREQPRVN